MWHRLSGLPDNVTDEGEIVEADGGRRLRSEKAQLRAAIADLSTAQASERDSRVWPAWPRAISWRGMSRPPDAT